MKNKDRLKQFKEFVQIQDASDERWAKKNNKPRRNRDWGNAEAFINEGKPRKMSNLTTEQAIYVISTRDMELVECELDTHNATIFFNNKGWCKDHDGSNIKLK